MSYFYRPFRALIRYKEHRILNAEDDVDEGCDIGDGDGAIVVDVGDVEVETVLQGILAEDDVDEGCDIADCGYAVTVDVTQKAREGQRKGGAWQPLDVIGFESDRLALDSQFGTEGLAICLERDGLTRGHVAMDADVAVEGHAVRGCLQASYAAALIADEGCHLVGRQVDSVAARTDKAYVGSHIILEGPLVAGPMSALGVCPQREHTPKREEEYIGYCLHNPNSFLTLRNTCGH